MATHGHLQLVGRWLNDLTLLTGARPPDAWERLTAIGSMLADDYPSDAAFCRESLRHVAQDCRLFPSYAEVQRSLGVWWKEHRPVLTALPPPAPPARVAPDPEALAAVRHLVRGLAADLGYPENGAPADRPVPVAGQARNGHLSDGQLLAAYQKLASEGDLAALTRIALLQKKLRENS